uniref:Replication protein A 70 kDa DNA-binding subunit B/D first OB fold domain-containing protein n=1 Tax=Brassica oleracea var. oleracea TaxID=109376 RepID=A0A0D3APB3_BRAOL
MAFSDVVVAHSAFDALRLGRSAQFIVGRLLRFWDSKNIKKQGEFMGITLLLLDEKLLIQNLTLRLQNSVIHGFIPSGRSPYYRRLLKAGSVVRVSSFEVARCTNMYKITDHPFVIRFIPQTTIDEVVANAPMINVEKFMIRKFDPLQALANTNLELPDVVGQIQSVQGSDLTAAGVMSRVVVRLMIEPMVVVYLSLWDDAASMFRGLISSGDRTQSVMVVTTVNPKIFGGL